MSYLPRMSKTYKEPEERTYDDTTKEITFNSIPIASALPDDKAYNPQSVLKQYSFYPHPPPQLPGPSLIAEAEQDEKLNVEAKRRRTRETSEQELESRGEATPTAEEFPYETAEKTTAVNFAVMNYLRLKGDDDADAPGRPSSAPRVTRSGRVLPKKSTVKTGKKKPEASKGKSSESSVVTENESVASKELRIACLDRDGAADETPSREGSYDKEKGSSASLAQAKSASSSSKSSVKRMESTMIDVEEGEEEEEEDYSPVPTAARGSVHQGVQCSPSGNAEKIAIMPPSVQYLLRTLSFLVQELDKSDGEDASSKEVKKLIGQISEAISSLSNRNVDSKFSLQTSLSDSKRLEKIYRDLERYVKHVYGENGKIGCKLEEKKRVYCELLQKEYELKVLNVKLRESEIQNPSLNMAEEVNKAPEIVLQNKDLENEQLSAEIEFNSQELKRYQQALAEKDWEIRSSKEEIVELKKKLAANKPKSKASAVIAKTYSPRLSSKDVSRRKTAKGVR